MAVVQHPYEAPFDGKAAEPESSGVEAWVGYFGYQAPRGAQAAAFQALPPAATVAEKHAVRSASKLTFTVPARGSGGGRGYGGRRLTRAGDQAQQA